jgi:hypothetical protein
MWSEKEKIETFEVIKLKEGQKNKVALILSLSGSIDMENLPAEVLEDCNVYELKPVVTTPNRNILRNKASYENFGKCYHDFLSRLETIHKSCDTIHLFAAAPVAAAISCGRGLMRDAQPAITIYDLSVTIYKPTITINAK